MSELPADWQSALRRRQALLTNERCLRLLHREVPSLRCDRFDTVCWAYWYSEADPSDEIRSHLDALCEAVGVHHWHLHGMSDRGKDPQRRRHWSSSEAPVEWRATEANLCFVMRADRGQSPGLFLDQRIHRRWVREHASGRRVANLFSYTGAFGLAAASGGATQVEQIDVSRSYLDWSAENAQLNELSGHTTEARVDAGLFLQGCRKRNRKFDAIICDPPSFARASRRGTATWRVVDDLPRLVEMALESLTEGGWMLVTSNHEGWSQTQMADGLAKVGARVEPAAGPGGDFETAEDESLLKGFILWR